MLSALKETIDEIYQQITQLSADAKTQSSVSDYEKSDSTLTQRLILLKKLARKMTSFEPDSVEYQSYQSFLQKLKDADAQEIYHLSQERVKVVAENAQQQKRTKAVNAYHQISLDR